VNELVLSTAALAAKRYGALIVLEREQGLRTYAETGIILDAAVSYDLLTTIFVPHAPLHDGAVIVTEGRLRAAACFLPLSTRAGLDREMGSRHRAAIGITEETDAVAIVVSEETGAISLVKDGAVRRGLEPRELGAALLEALSPASAVRRMGRAPGGSLRAEDETARPDAGASAAARPEAGR
jgi:diadenylate cyclase